MMAIVTCATLMAALAAATPGTTLTLQQGSLCEEVHITNRRIEGKPVTINATGSRISGLRMIDSKGLQWKGGTFVARDGRVGQGQGTYGALIRNSEHIRMEGGTFTDAVRGLVISGSNNVQIVNNDFVNLRMDGINFASSKDSLLDGNRFTGFDPILSRCDLKDGSVRRRISNRDCKAAGGVWTDGDHSDAIQMWNHPHNVRIVNNNIHGHAHGIALLGAGKTASQIVVENNIIRISTPHGITLEDCTDCRIVGNDISPAEGARFDPSIRAARSTGDVCGNKVAGTRGQASTRARCK